MPAAPPGPTPSAIDSTTAASAGTAIVRLESIDAFDRFKDALTTDPRLDVKVLRQSEHYAAQSRAIVGIVAVQLSGSLP